MVLENWALNFEIFLLFSWNERRFVLWYGRFGCTLSQPFWFNDEIKESLYTCRLWSLIKNWLSFRFRGAVVG